MGGEGHKGPFGGFSPRFVLGPLQSNTFATNSKPRMLIKQTMINKRRRAVAKVKQLLPLERRWYFALLLSKVRVMYGGKAPMKKVKEIARRAGVSVTTLNRWCKDANAGTSLMRQSGCGRPRAVTAGWMKKWFLEQHKKWKGKWNVRMMVREMQRTWGGLGSMATVCRIAHECGFRLARPRLLPIISGEHMKKREAFAEYLTGNDSPFNDGDTFVGFMDEKWFVRHRRSCVWVAPGENRPAELCTNKLHEAQVMFLGAVAMPRVQHGFNGGVGLWPVGYIGEAQHKSAYRVKGAREFIKESMTKDYFIKMLTTKLIPATLERCGKWAAKIVWFMDNAGGHGGGRGDMDKTTIAELNEWCKVMLPKNKALRRLCKGGKFPIIEFRTQPPHSPDMNVLDNGAWWSLQVAMDAVNDEHPERATETTVHDAVLEA